MRPATSHTRDGQQPSPQARCSSKICELANDLRHNGLGQLSLFEVSDRLGAVARTGGVLVDELLGSTFDVDGASERMVDVAGVNASARRVLRRGPRSTARSSSILFSRTRLWSTCATDLRGLSMLTGECTTKLTVYKLSAKSDK